MRHIYLTDLPTCNLCAEEAQFDCPTTTGPWAFLCPQHFNEIGTDFGTRFIKGEEPEIDRGTAINEALYAGDIDLAMDLIGDGDIAEWI